MRGIATRANVAPMGIYNHFAGKMGIYEARWIEGFDRLTASMELAQTTINLRDDVIDCGRRYRNFALANPSHYRLMFMDDIRDFTPSPVAAAASGRAFQIVVNRVERAQAAHVFPNSRAIDIAQGIWAAVHGYVSLELLCVNFASDAHDAYDSLLGAVFDGFASRGSNAKD